MQRREVVTAFLRRNDELLLLRRSGDVGSYQGRWSAVSGYLEDPTPLAQAKREILEECGLPASELTLIAVAAPLQVPAPELDTLWIVHPFLFELAGDLEPSLDWENLECRWVSPETLADLDCVPALAEALDACLATSPANLSFTLALEEIACDRDHGAAQLGRMALRALEELVADGTVPLDEAACQRLTHFAGQLQRARPSMAPLDNLVAAWRAGIVATEVSGQDLAKRARQLRAESRSASRRAARHFAGLLKPGCRILTLSLSSTVKQALLESADLDLQVIIAESRPLCEGAALAKSLAAAGISVTLVTDAQMAAMAVEADLAVIGADCVTAEGAVINKSGSHLLALAAAEARIPLYAVYESMKRLAAGRPPPPMEMMPAGELGHDLPDGVEIVNRYFEMVPADLVAMHVTEEGCRGGAGEEGPA